MGCSISSTFNVTAEQGVVATVTSIPASCQTVNSIKGGIEVEIASGSTTVPGPYFATIEDLSGIQNDTIFDLIGGPNPKRTIFGLNNGSYQVTVSSFNGGCDYEEITLISGPVSTVDFEFVGMDSTVNCLGETASITLGNIIGVQSVPFEVTLFDVDGTPVQTFPSVQYQEFAGSGFRIQDVSEGSYYIIVSQNQPGCTEPIFKESDVFRIVSPPGTLGAKVIDKVVSHSDAPSGSLRLEVEQSGGAPYFGRIELLEVYTPPLSIDEIDNFNSTRDWVQITRNENQAYRTQFSGLYAGVYNIYVEDNFGCMIVLRDSINQDTNIFIPNIFTPNGDGYNDVFFIRNLPLEGTTLVVTNRMGGKVFESNNYNPETLWDGGEVTDGVYYYYFKFPGGEERRGWVEIWRGTRP